MYRTVVMSYIYIYNVCYIVANSTVQHIYIHLTYTPYIIQYIEVKCGTYLSRLSVPSPPSARSLFPNSSFISRSRFPLYNSNSSSISNSSTTTVTVVSATSVQQQFQYDIYHSTYYCTHYNQIL